MFHLSGMYRLLFVTILFSWTAVFQFHCVYARIIREEPEAYRERELLKAARDGDLETVRRLVDSGVPKESMTSSGTNALLLAAFNGHAGIVEFLVEAGADISHRDTEGRDALMHAASRGWLEIVKYLVSKGASARNRDTSGETALIKAVKNGHVDVVRFLANETSGCINLRDKKGWTALMHAGRRRDKKGEQLVKILVEAGASVSFGSRFP